MNLAEFGGESGLLDAAVDGQRNDEHLLPVSQMSKRHQQTVTDLPANNDTSHSSLRNANPRGIFQTRVYGFDGLQARVTGYPGLIMSVRPVQYSTVSGHLSEADS